MSDQKQPKQKKDLLYWIKVITLITPLLGGGTYYGATQWEDDDEPDEIIKIDAEKRPIQMQQDDVEYRTNEIINLDKDDINDK